MVGLVLLFVACTILYYRTTLFDCFFAKIELKRNKFKIPFHLTVILFFTSVQLHQLLPSFCHFALTHTLHCDWQCSGIMGLSFHLHISFIVWDYYYYRTGNLYNTLFVAIFIIFTFVPCLKLVVRPWLKM